MLLLSNFGILVLLSQEGGGFLLCGACPTVRGQGRHGVCTLWVLEVPCTPEVHTAWGSAQWTAVVWQPIGIPSKPHGRLELLVSEAAVKPP